MKLHEEFKLYENMWEGLSNRTQLNETVDDSRFTKQITYDGDAAAIANRKRFPLQINTTDQMITELHSQKGYRGYRLINVIEGNTVVQCLVKLDKDNKILDRAPSNVDLDNISAINDYINKNTSSKSSLTESPSTANEIIRR